MFTHCILFYIYSKCNHDGPDLLTHAIKIKVSEFTKVLILLMLLLPVKELSISVQIKLINPKHVVFCNCIILRKTTQIVSPIS